MGSWSCLLLNSFNGTSLGVLHWKLRMDTHGEWLVLVEQLDGHSTISAYFNFQSDTTREAPPKVPRSRQDLDPLYV